MLLDLVDVGHGQANVIKSVNKAVFPELLNFKLGQFGSIRSTDDLVGKVDFDFFASVRFVSDAFQDSLVSDTDGQHTVLEGVVKEDVAERWGDDALDAEIEERPGCVLAT
jgi:hypothetical protein